jgi:hypothetical protein
LGALIGLEAFLEAGNPVKGLIGFAALHSVHREFANESGILPAIPQKLSVGPEFLSPVVPRGS